MTVAKQNITNRRKKINKALEDMTAKEQRVCAALQIPPQDYIIIMDKIHI